MTDGGRAALEVIGELPDSEIVIADAGLQLARIEYAGGRVAIGAHLSPIARDAVRHAAEVASDDLRALRSRSRG